MERVSLGIEVGGEGAERVDAGANGCNEHPR